MTRRGLTLLELLLAIGLLLGLGALVFPTMLNGFHERAFVSSAEIVRNQLLLARAHAQATGEPVEVTYYTDPPRVEARLFQAGLPPSRQAEDDQLGPLSLDGDESDREGLIFESWAYRRLVDGVWVVDRPIGPSPELDEEDAFAGLDDEALDDRPEERRPIRLAVLMPDGSALLGEPVWISDDDGRLGTLSVNPWTGLASFERVKRMQGESPPPTDTQPEDELDRFAGDEIEPANRFEPPVAPQGESEEDTER